MRSKIWGEVGRGAWRVLGAGVALGLLVGGCTGDCSDEIAEGQKFLDEPANLACESDADCEVVSTGCHTYAHGICGQAQVSRTAAASARWKTIQDNLDDCGITGCAQCDAALIPHCVEGSCGGTP